MIVHLLGIPLALCQPQGALDQRDLPPVERRFSSANGAYELVVLAEDGWKTRRANAVLAKGKRTVWKAAIPQSFGPRDASVLADGQVVFFDEWINIASATAVLLVNAKGKERARFSYDDIRRLTGKPARELTRGANAGPYGRGPWMASRPEVRGSNVIIRAAGVMLRLDCLAGKLDLADD